MILLTVAQLTYLWLAARHRSKCVTCTITREGGGCKFSPTTAWHIEEVEEKGIHHVCENDPLISLDSCDSHGSWNRDTALALCLLCVIFHTFIPPVACQTARSWRQNVSLWVPYLAVLNVSVTEHLLFWHERLWRRQSINQQGLYYLY